MNDDLIQYILTQEHAGYTDEQIKQALLLQGRSQNEVEAIFREAHSAQLDPLLQDYVQQYARQGSTPLQIYSTLKTQGYAPARVRKAIISVFGPGTLPKDHHPMAFAIIALVVIAGGIYFLNPGHILSRDSVQQVEAMEFSLSDHIAQILVIAKNSGPQAAIAECRDTLRDTQRDTCILDVAIMQPGGDGYCGQIADVTLKDTCLMNFIDKDRDGICAQVSLRENIETCHTLAALRRK